jgi:hypothetical protein
LFFIVDVAPDAFLRDARRRQGCRSASGYAAFAAGANAEAKAAFAARWRRKYKR